MISEACFSVDSRSPRTLNRAAGATLSLDIFLDHASVLKRKVYLAAVISSTMACVAARGAEAARIGRPTTKKSAPARIASAGGAGRGLGSALPAGGFFFGRPPGGANREKGPPAFGGGSGPFHADNT